MKKIILLLLFTVPVMAQDGFKVEDGVIVWEKVFPVANADIASILDHEPNLKIQSVMDNFYRGQGISVQNTCTSGSVLMKCDTQFDFTIYVSQEEYVVKIKNFCFLEKYGPMQARTVPNSLNKYYLEYGKIRNSPKTQTDIACIDSFLTGLFLWGANQSSTLTSN